MTSQERLAKVYEAGKVFTPSAPIDDYALFAGRKNEIDRILKAVAQKGRHVVVYGDRGVGKTSLTNVLGEILDAIAESSEMVIRINAASDSTAASLWRSVFREIPVETLEKKIGFAQLSEVIEADPLSGIIPDNTSPEDIRHLFQTLESEFVIIFDEFDRVENENTIAAISDTIKALSDHAVRVTLIIVGVASSLEDLIGNHPSIQRALVQIPMRRMNNNEIEEILTKGLARLSMTIDVDALARVAKLSQGLPHYAHLLALNASTEAIDADKDGIDLPLITKATACAVEQAEYSIRTAYLKAISSPRGNLYAQVLLACALAKSDELGYFYAGAVKEPMKRIMNKEYNIAAFARHLTDFSSPNRGPIIEKEGSRGRFIYRFVDPTMQPYVIMRGLAEGLIEEELWEFS